SQGTSRIQSAAGLEENLHQLLPQRRGRAALIAAKLDQPLQADLEFIPVLAGWAPRQVLLDFAQLLVAQLAIHVPLQLLETPITIHADSFSSRTIPDSRA